MNKLLLQSALLPAAGAAPARKDILIENGRFAQIADRLAPRETENAEVVDCASYAVMPAFYNGHTHAAMTLLRGYADDMELGRWLTQYIWPFEARLTADDIEIGSRLAVLEMIKSGTVFFADMYWQRERTIKVVEEMGVRAAIGVTIADVLLSKEQLEECFTFLSAHTGESDRVKLVVMPHAVYTVTEATLRRCIATARAENYLIHTHLCETAKEVADCEAQYGCGPVELWRRLGGLDDRLVAAHCVQFTPDDIRAFAAAGATAVLNPTSNLKLSSGIPPIPALLAKVQGTAETLPAQAALDMATRNAARAYGLPDGAGEIREGAPADCLLVDLRNERMVPAHDLVSNWVYSAASTAIDTVICAGRILMRHRRVDGEEEIVEEAQACARRLAAR